MNQYTDYNCKYPGVGRPMVAQYFQSDIKKAYRLG